MKIVVLASGGGSNLGALIAAIDAGACAATIALVVSDKPSAPALARAEARGITTAVVSPSSFVDRSAWDLALSKRVAEAQPSLVVLAGFMRIVGPATLAAFAGRIINVHPALLPSFPGKDGPAQAIAARVRISGCTVHVVDEGIDTGPILAQAAVPVLPEDDVPSLHARIQRVEHQLLPRVVDAIGKGQILLGARPTLSASLFDEGASLLSPSRAGQAS